MNVFVEAEETTGRPGDWLCRVCQHLNFQRRDSCQRCGESRSGDFSGFGGRGGKGPNVRPSDWYCTAGNCGAHNFASRSSCFKCGEFKNESAGGFAGRDGFFGFTTGSNLRPGHWYRTAGICGAYNFASRSSCFKCGACKDDSATGGFYGIPRSKAFGGNRSGWKSGDWICTRKKYEEDCDDHDKKELLGIGQDVRQEPDKLDGEILGISNFDSAEDIEKCVEDDLIPISQAQMSSISEANRHDKIEGEIIIPSKSGASIEIEEEQGNQDGGDTSGSASNSCIFRTPLPGIPFQAPELVSIGPYHSGKNLPLNKFKYSFLDKFLSRTRNQGKDLGFYVRQLMALEWRARKCYSEDLSMASPDFVEMMLVDACLIIEVLRHFGKSPEELGHGGFFLPIEPWQIPILVRDLLILENQIPFFVLDKLFELSDDHESDKGMATVITMALKFFDLAFPISLHLATQFNHLKVPKHLLDLFIQSILPSSPYPKILFPEFMARMVDYFAFYYYHLTRIHLVHILSPDFQLFKNIRRRINPKLVSSKPIAAGSKQKGSKPSTSKTAKVENIVHVKGSASELRKSGIRFSPRRAESFTDIHFKNGVLEIPPVTINDLFMAILVNCVGFEHSSGGLPKDITAYVCFMSDLIRNPADVECLNSDGIISRFSHHGEKVLSFFGDLRSKMSDIIDMDINLLQDCYLSKTVMEIDKHNSSSMSHFRRDRDTRIFLFSITTLCFSFYVWYSIGFDFYFYFLVSIFYVLFLLF